MIEIKYWAGMQFSGPRQTAELLQHSPKYQRISRRYLSEDRRKNARRLTTVLSSFVTRLHQCVSFTSYEYTLCWIYIQITRGIGFWKGAARHHRRSLRKLSRGATPKELQIKVTPNVSIRTQFKNKWQDAIRACEKQFVEILKNFHQDRFNLANFNNCLCLRV